MKANKEFRNEVHVCKNCGKTYHPRYSSRGLFCCLKCYNEYKIKKNYEDYLNNQQNYQGVRNMQKIKPFILKEQDNKCAICGLPNVWNNKTLIFILDHIDGRADNNFRDNLRLICPNCDSQLDTYKSKNKNSARVYHRLNHR